MSVSSIGNSVAFTSDMAASFFKKADANGDGGIDKTELKTMLSQSPGGQNGSQNIDKIFAQADTNGDGKIDQSENETQMNKIGGKGGTPPSGGTPPAGGAKGASGASASSASSSAKIYDKEDLNKDGTVTAQEKIEYEISHPSYDKTGTLSIGATQSQLNVSA